MKKSTNIKAVALKYKAYEDNAPKVVAKGKGVLAQKIIQKAKEYDVPLFQNEALADMLLSVEVGEEIPPKMYEAVVEVFVWLYNLEEKAQLSKG
ncbi:EscU/YscU/HrcU family type III secretion system export apparatus switch protein [Caminibacter pacificus]|uniref:Flagellar biosynthesis protein n=1 Tax=Caminibacter pacificus TaxID=1424653 RepID=A0AAJ4UXE6_9BACT|nr:EscU/YscU/HrcU family type III secretion system export apparatus switch protein [Caminibacter pacificus]NPA87842.1 flagellar biosynthesis protein FlhB [Campylobacterota bacterium]QCI29137.1 flagellar biosynthesis protein FlhB [Caminibacter pacificus]ROR39044.1 flagellar biosynthesis protein [Caminibacter pacificus]